MPGVFKGGRDKLFGQFRDQADFFCDRDEHVGYQQAELRRIPASEHLEADQFAGRDVYLALIERDVLP